MAGATAILYENDRQGPFGQWRLENIAAQGAEHGKFRATRKVWSERSRNAMSP